MTDETVVLDETPDPDEELEQIRSALEAEYEIHGELGRGGMAVVYRARERALERDVAIKVLPLARTFDAEFVERFQREARLSAALEHPHIVPIYRVGQVGRVNYFVMKYMPGPSLAGLLDGGERLAADEVEKALLDVADALEYAHLQGVVHRDVKPDNIMRDGTGRFVVMDFGIAKSLVGEQLTQAGGSIGTPKYMSPEQAKGGELDGASDFYSLGVVAYQCLVGRPPFVGDDPMAILYSHLHDPIPDPGPLSGEEGRLFDGVRALMAKAPSDRPRSVEELRSAFVASPASSGTPGAGAAALDREKPVSRAVIPHGVREWFQARTRRFGIAGGAVTLFLFALLARDPAASACRAALPNADDDDRAVLLEPLGAVEAASSVDVSFTLCGVPDGQLFEARVTIRPADDGGVVGRVGRFLGGGDDPVRISWDDRADGFATSRTRSIPLPMLEPGAYQVALRIEEAGGRDYEERHDFTVGGG